jgi:hypothetical protein
MSKTEAGKQMGARFSVARLRTSMKTQEIKESKRKELRKAIQKRRKFNRVGWNKRVSKQRREDYREWANAVIEATA